MNWGARSIELTRRIASSLIGVAAADVVLEEPFMMMTGLRMSTLCVCVLAIWSLCRVLVSRQAEGCLHAVDVYRTGSAVSRRKSRPREKVRA